MNKKEILARFYFQHNIMALSSEKTKCMTTSVKSRRCNWNWKGNTTSDKILGNRDKLGTLRKIVRDQKNSE